MLRVGVIGCGSIAKQRHGYEYFHNANVEIKGFFDRRQERVEALTALYGGRVYATIDEMLADSEIDAVSVCLANAAHAEVSIKALRAGKHVLCEKPMAVTLEECEAMLAAARESGKRLMIATISVSPRRIKRRRELRRGRAWARDKLPVHLWPQGARNVEHGQKREHVVFQEGFRVVRLHGRSGHT